jgi:hypothetical protein
MEELWLLQSQMNVSIAQLANRNARFRQLPKAMVFMLSTLLNVLNVSVISTNRNALPYVRLIAALKHKKTGMN